MWDRATDGPLRGNEWFVCETDQPMVPYRVTRNSYVGPIDRWSLFEVACDLFMGPINRWYYIVHLWGRSTGRPVLHTSLPTLVRWTGGLHVDDDPMGHTVHVMSKKVKLFYRNRVCILFIVFLLFQFL